MVAMAAPSSTISNLAQFWVVLNLQIAWAPGALMDPATMTGLTTRTSDAGITKYL